MKTRLEYLGEITGDQNRTLVALMTDEIEDVIRESLRMTDENEAKKLLTELVNKLF